jgi:hypothetical protein
MADGIDLDKEKLSSFTTGINPPNCLRRHIYALTAIMQRFFFKTVLFYEFL